VNLLSSYPSGLVLTLAGRHGRDDSSYVVACAGSSLDNAGPVTGNALARAGQARGNALDRAGNNVQRTTSP